VASIAFPSCLPVLETHCKGCLELLPDLACHYCASVNIYIQMNCGGTNETCDCGLGRQGANSHSEQQACIFCMFSSAGDPPRALSLLPSKRGRCDRHHKFSKFKSRVLNLALRHRFHLMHLKSQMMYLGSHVIHLGSQIMHLASHIALPGSYITHLWSAL
jgi:hypothetical protein